MTFDYLQAKFKQPLHPLSADPAFHGIYAVKSGYLDSSLVGVTDQFLEHAADYDIKYFNYDRSKRIVEASLKLARTTPSNPEVLDVGSGSGNSVLPILDMFTEARVVATDISPQLLVLLRNNLARRPGWLERCGLVCGDALEARLHKNSFDIAIGSAILHHLLDPANAIRQVCSSVRPGGCALFFEPFEIGSAMLRLIYERLLAERSSLKITKAVAEMLQRLVTDIRVRSGPDKTIYPQLDDKWLFTRTFFEEQARANGVSVIVSPLHAAKDSFRNQTLHYLQIVLGGGESLLSSKAWDMIRYYDEAFSEELKSEMLIEGCVLFQK
jgi:ubiquinone/menaquinone biosynthesis C-methylase UbiE